MKKDLIDVSSPESLAEFIQRPAIKIAEALTGVLATDLSGLKLIAGRVVQGAVKFKLLTQLGRELKVLTEKGKIKEDYFATHKNKVSLLELLKFIDENPPDEEVFEAIKSIFFTEISQDTTEQDALLAHELLRICKQLNSLDILVLKSCYKLYQDSKIGNEPPPTPYGGISWWTGRVSTELKLPEEMVLLAENNLNKLKLIDDRIHADRSGIRSAGTFQLTKLGLKFCEFSTKYNNIEKNQH